MTDRTDPLPSAEALERASRAIYERTRGGLIPGVIEGGEVKHVGTGTLALDALTAAYALDVPRIRAEERAAAQQETERLRAIIRSERDPEHPGSLAFQLREQINPEDGER